MNDHYVKNVIEAALLAAGRPLASNDLVSLFDERDGSNPEEVTAAIEGLRSDYENRGLELVEVASGYRIQIRAAVAQPVSRLWQERPTKYSRALLETLALVAYRQPITRGEIEQIRGVAVNPNIIKTLLERAWIRVVGHRDVPGRPELLGTTRDFLDYFGLQKLDDLPTLSQLKELEDLRLQLNLSGADRVAPEPGAGQPGDREPAPGQSAAGPPPVYEPGVGQPATGAPATGAPAAGETAAGETAAGETATGETATGETATGETATSETATGETATGDSRSHAAVSGAIDPAAARAAAGDHASRHSEVAGDAADSDDDLDSAVDDRPTTPSDDDASEDAHSRLQGLVASSAADDGT